MNEHSGTGERLPWVEGVTRATGEAFTEVKEFSVVGKSLPRIDAVAKATGDAKFTHDLVLPRMLYGKILRSPYPHARILNINTGKAEKLPGVKAVVTGKDTPGIKHGNWRRYPQLMDRYPLAIDRVRFIGDEVAAVAAIDEDIAQEALGLIEVEYEELPAVFDPLEAIKEGAPQLHDEFKGNINPRAIRRIEFGDVEQGFKESEYIREDRFSLQPVTHTPLETHVALASFDASGKLAVWTSTQAPFIVHWLLAMTLGMSEGEIRIIKPHVGGGFGAKLELFGDVFCSALLCRKTGRAVKIDYTRNEEFSSTHRKHPITYEVKIGVKKDGTFIAKEVRAILDGGAYTSMSPTATYLCGFFHTWPYRFPNYRYNGYPVYTNKSPSSAMRGFGGTQATTASETQIDMIADDLGIDPLELRLKNAAQSGDVVPGHAKAATCGFSECLTKASASAQWSKKRGKLPSGRGIGIAGYSYTAGGPFNWISTSYAFSNALIRINSDGTVDLFSGGSDIGQGMDTILCQIAAEELGVRMEDVRIITADTAITPVDLGSWSSRGTLMMGNAVKAAAADAKRQLFEIAMSQLKPNVIHELEARDGRIYIKLRPDRGISFAEAVQGAQRAKEGAAIIGRGSYTPRGVSITSPAFSFGTQVAEVEVDRETGQVKVLRITVAHDCGQPINPMFVEGQLEGSISMGLGYALSEELLTDRGKVLNPCFADYRIPRAPDMPEVESIVVVTRDPEGPFGAKEAGEGLTNPVAAAIGNAIANAVGVRINDLPWTPEKILRALNEKEKSRT